MKKKKFQLNFAAKKKIKKLKNEKEGIDVKCIKFFFPEIYFQNNYHRWPSKFRNVIMKRDYKCNAVYH